MECSICYCSQANCKLACKHLFCSDCIKQWYIKAPIDTQPTCPMCRTNLYFKGMRDKVEEWEEEHRDFVFQKIFEDKLEDLLEEVNCYTMCLLDFITSRLKKIKEYDIYIDQDNVDYFIFNDYNCKKVFKKKEKPSWQNRLKISKHTKKKYLSKKRIGRF
jgi:hypothetical protein